VQEKSHFFQEKLLYAKKAVESHNNFLQAKSYLRLPTTIVVILLIVNDL
jgi:hypothetical protein